MYTGKDYEKNLEKLEKLTAKQKDELFEIEQKAIDNYYNSQNNCQLIT